MGEGFGGRPADIRLLEEQLQAAERDARAVVEGLTEEQGQWCATAASGVRLSLATGLHVLAAHERRHLWQAWRVRREAERAQPASTLR